MRDSSRWTHHVFSSDYSSSTAIIWTVRIRYSVKSIPLELSFSNSLSHNTKLTIPGVHVCTCTDITSCIILLKDTLLLSSYSTLGIWRLRAVSTYGSLANCWQTQSVHYQNDTTLSIHMCAYTCISSTYTTYYSCRGQPSELDIPWSDVQRIGSLSWDSFFVSCLNLKNIITAASSRSSQRMIHNISLVLLLGFIYYQNKFDTYWSLLSFWRKCKVTYKSQT